MSTVSVRRVVLVLVTMAALLAASFRVSPVFAADTSPSAASRKEEAARIADRDELLAGGRTATPSEPELGKSPRRSDPPVRFPRLLHALTAASPWSVAPVVMLERTSRQVVPPPGRARARLMVFLN